MQSIINRYTHDESTSTTCVQAEHKQQFVKIMLQRATKTFELVHSDTCGPFATPTSGSHKCNILIINDYMGYISVWVLPNMKEETCTAVYQSFQARLDSMGYEIKRLRCDNGNGEYDNKTFRLVVAACCITYAQCPPYVHHKNGVAERMIMTITEKAHAMLIDSQAPIEFWGEAVNSVVYLHQRSPN
jgi:hypothetical protein